jgi:alpha-aminoadipic semialdehyde synthase
VANRIGIRRETKGPWERRSPLVPSAVRRLARDRGLEVVVQPSARRVFSDKEFVRAGAVVSDDLSTAQVVLGIKEIPTHLLEPRTAYLFFAHVIKGQRYNMPMLARLLELGCTLVDYEKICDDTGRRLVFFGRFAGLAGMIDSLWALGQRLSWEGLDTPFAALRPAHGYDSLAEAQKAIRAAGDAVLARGLPAGLTPLIIGILGYGNVARGARELLADLPTTEIAPDQVADAAAGRGTSPSGIFQVTYKEQHVVRPREADHTFDLQDYYDHPGRYRGCFAPHLEHLTVLLNCNYWDHRYSRLVKLDHLRALWARPSPPRLRVIGDLSCDIAGSMECTVRSTDPGDPVYVWDPDSGDVASGVAGHGPVVLAVDILPAELPRDASEAFSEILMPFLPALAAADLGRDFSDLALPPELKRAVIAHRGDLTPSYRYLEADLATTPSTRG